MIGRYRQAQEKNRSRYYFLLSIIVIFAMFKWGVPMFVNILAGKGAVIDKTETDIIPPQAPVLSALPEATNSSRIQVEGFTEAQAKVEILINDVLDNSAVANPDGSFSFLANLKTGMNRIQIRAVDNAQNANLSEVKLVTFDSEQLTLTIASPKDGTEFIGKNSQVVEIVGKTNKANSQVVANNTFVDVNRDGTFVHKYLLSSGENKIKILATDKAGNSAETNLTIIYTP